MEIEVAAQPTAPTERGRRRREAIVDAATRLFARQGFHPTGIDEIGEAAGITGPGIYRHFEAKEDLLIAALDRIWEALHGAAEAAPDLAPAVAFERLVATHARLAIDQPAAVIVLLRELRHAPDWYRRAAQRNEQRYLDIWAEVVSRLNDRLGPDDARTTARAITTMIWSRAAEPRTRRSDPDRYLSLVSALARAAVGAVPA